jgi:uncharacterized protein (TIGR03437 family)
MKQTSRFYLILLLLALIPAATGGASDPALADDNAAFKSQSLQAVYPPPAHLPGAFPQALPEHIHVRPGARVAFAIEMFNNGNSDWLSTNPGSCALIPRPDERAWGGGKGLGANAMIFPGSGYTFNFGVIAPEVEQPGGHHFQWRMQRNPFAEGAPPTPFGEMTPAIRIHVDGARPVGTVSFPPAIAAGQSFTIAGTSADNEGQDNSGVHNVWVSVDGKGGAAGQVNGSWSRWNYEVAGLSAGRHTVVANITDRAGNVATTGHFAFDTASPPQRLTVKAPPVGALSSATNPCMPAQGQSQCAATISWKTADTATAQVWYSQDGGSPQFLACGARGEKVVNEIQAGHVYRFFLYPAASCEAEPIAESLLGAMAVTATRPSVGLNKPDLFFQYRGNRVNQAMARKAVLDARSFGPAWFRIQVISDLSFWRRDPATYWRPFDQMLVDLEANGMRIVPVFLGFSMQMRQVTGETAAQLINDPNSESYKLLVAYITDFINRYRNRPSIYFYELANGLNREAEALLGDGSSFSTDQMIAFTGRLAAEVRRLDPTHLIASGHWLPNAFAEVFRGRGAWRPNSGGYRPDTLAEFQKYLAETHEGLDIASVQFYNQFSENERFGITGKNNAGLLEVVKQAADAAGKQLFVSAFSDVTPYLNQNPNAPFTQNTLNKIIQLRIPYSAPWAWEYYQSNTYTTYNNQSTFANLEPGYTDAINARIRQANLSLGNSIPATQLPDATAPQVVLTWPFDNTQMAPVQLVHAVASDDNGAAARVEFLVDDSLRATITRPPYQFMLNAASLSPGVRRLVVKAYDAAGNVAQDGVNLTRPASFSTITNVQATSFSGLALASEAIATAFGFGLAATAAAADSSPLPTELAGTQVTIRDSGGREGLAPLFYVSPGQINYLVPHGAALGAATVTVTSASGAVSTGPIEIARVAPGLFTANASGSGLAAATALRVGADGSRSYEPVVRFDAAQNRFVAVPIDLGEASDQVFLLLFGSGLRDGATDAASVTVGGEPAEVVYAGAQGSYAGLDQVNVRVPRELAGRGEVDVVMIVGGLAANTVRVSIR